MTYKASDVYVDIAPGGIAAPERTGFTVVEWGDAFLKKCRACLFEKRN